MKRLITMLVSCVLLLAASLSASSGYEVKFSSAKSSEYQLNFDLQNFKIEQKSVNGSSYSVINFGSDIRTNQKGYAELPFLSSSVELPADRNVSMKIIPGNFKDYQLNTPLLPSRGIIYRNQDIDKIPYQIATESVKNSWYPGDLAQMSEPFIVRDIRGTSVKVYPFQYNAATRTLRVYDDIKVVMEENSSRPVNPLQIINTSPALELSNLYSSMFINHKANKALSIGQQGDILVVYTSRDQSAIQPYIQWKREKGHKVIESVVTTGTNVKTTIKNAYTANPNIMYVQLVGDWADIKSDMGTSQSAPMDPMLGCVNGTDNYPDVIIGRFSAASATDVTTQVNKAINYEKNPDATGTWYGKGLGIASAEGSGQGDDGEADYTHMANIRNKRLIPAPLSYSTVYEAYDNLATVSATTVANYVNAGLGIINYVGHGSETAFVTSNYGVSNANSSTNGNKLPFIFSVACVNGKFHRTSGDCFAEALLKKNGGGAVASLMATINLPWQPPMRGQDYFNDILRGGYTYSGSEVGTNVSEQRTTFGSIVLNGQILAYNQSSQTDDLETLQSWSIFGDASLQVRTATPKALSITPGTITAGSAYSLTVKANGNNVANALVSLYQNGNTYSALTNSSGVASISNNLSNGTAKLTVTAFNTTTYSADVTVGGGTVPPTPTVAITAPANNSSYTVGATVNVTAAASENAKSISKVEFYVDNALKATDTSAPYEYAWNTTGAATGAHAVKALVTSSYDKTAENSITVNLTGNDPSVTAITEGFEGTTFPPAGWTITSGWYQSATYYAGSKSAAAKYKPANTCNLVTPAINVSGTSSLEFYWKNNDPAKIVGHDTTFCEISTNGTTWTRLGFLAATSAQSSYSKAAYDITNYPGTAVKIRWRYKTNGSSSAYGITVDDVKVTTGQVVTPVTSIAISAPANNANVVKGNSVTITTAVSEKSSASLLNSRASYKVEFYVDNSLLSTDTSSPFEYAWNTASATIGAHAIKTVVTNMDNNQTATAQISVNVIDGSTPVTLISEGFEGTTFPPTGWTLGSTSAWSKGSEAYAGSKCARALYNTAGTKILNAPAVAISAGAATTLEFWWKNDDISAKIVKYDTTFCEISTNGTTWTRLGFLSAASSQSAYTKFTANVSAYTGTAVKIRWRYKTDGSYSAYGVGLDEVKLVSTTVKENRETAILPEVTNMISNYPNPFNPATTISFAINTASEVKLAVYNANGEIVKVLKEGFVNAGNHTVSFDGSALNSGMYFYTLSTQNGTMKGKMLLVK